MKRVLLAVCAAVVIGGSAAAALQDQDFVLVNKTGLTIDELYLSPINDEEWGNDVLGKDVLKHNEKITIEFSHKESECMWDMKIVDADDDDIIWEDFNLCKIHEITLLYQNKKPTAITK